MSKHQFSSGFFFLLFLLLLFACDEETQKFENNNKNNINNNILTVFEAFGICKRILLDNPVFLVFYDCLVN